MHEHVRICTSIYALLPDQAYRCSPRQSSERLRLLQVRPLVISVYTPSCSPSCVCPSPPYSAFSRFNQTDGSLGCTAPSAQRAPVLPVITCSVWCHISFLASCLFDESRLAIFRRAWGAGDGALGGRCAMEWSGCSIKSVGLPRGSPYFERVYSNSNPNSNPLVPLIPLIPLIPSRISSDLRHYVSQRQGKSAPDRQR